jgi:hypothetical protein
MIWLMVVLISNDLGNGYTASVVTEKFNTRAACVESVKTIARTIERENRGYHLKITSSTCKEINYSIPQ